jgi:hypothetical protein
MTKVEETTFLEAWAKDANPSNAPELVKIGRQILRALEALEPALDISTSGRAELHPGNAEALAKLIVRSYGPIYAHDVVSPDVREIALAVLGG